MGIGLSTDITPFSAEDWPTNADDYWAVDTSGAGSGGYWKALSPDNPLGNWVDGNNGGGTPDGINSIFPRLWWEEETITN